MHILKHVCGLTARGWWLCLWEQLLDARTGRGGWLVPQEQDVVDVCLCLTCPAVVTEVQLTVKNGSQRCAFPTLLSVWVGPHCDALTQVYANLRLPLADDGARLAFPLPPSFSPQQLPSGQLAPDLVAGKGAPRVSRIVHIQLARAPDCERPIILGKIAVHGRPLGAARLPDSGVNLLADALAEGGGEAKGMSTEGMVEKKALEGAKATARDLGGKALAKADELVGKYGGEETKRLQVPRT